MDASRNYPRQFSNQFELYDFVDDPNFDQFIDLIRGETEDAICGYDYDLIEGVFVDDKQISSTPGDPFGLDASITIVPYPNSVFDPLQSFYGEMMKDGEEDNDEEHSSGTTTGTATSNTMSTTTKKGKVDRSRTLISERRRRGRMKEKLYALRSLVPNITKMDKASIIGDAVLYAQDLQTQAKKLKAEIAGLEATLAGSERYQESVNNPVKVQVARTNSHPICKKIMQLNMFQVEERGFYFRLICNRGEGVAISLYKTLESLTNCKVQNSNLATVSECFVLTFTLNVRDCEQSVNLPNLKLWVSGALLNHGFEFVTPLLS
ncbi:Transcription factor FER-LIKE IRON DEFICIENCY-INDUCED TRANSCRIPTION FACTOR [Hibiscus syriacus]|uniref:Transcription factor FER-LIKE IRON DEFICIENCY-INDUCED TRANSCRIPTION FACTOR n=1 Tax=Hibiscus syriacus TaxID=106335 RepID=A0A6A3CLN6_HIBSY|nr:transcription factor FER-LIKE IRON DEFICIENCY-INDUCED TRANSCRIPTION FACTOR-like [Hibiscus syriacus]KAE8729424.1 Transcription factor FER-LIKE IRON DEFICIENCY-INDUCED TRANSCRIPTION FACTOR [Hibiscus syriacus]